MLIWFYFYELRLERTNKLNELSSFYRPIYYANSLSSVFFECTQTLKSFWLHLIFIKKVRFIEIKLSNCHCEFWRSTRTQKLSLELFTVFDVFPKRGKFEIDFVTMKKYWKSTSPIYTLVAWIFKNIFFFTSTKVKKGGRLSRVKGDFSEWR